MMIELLKNYCASDKSDPRTYLHNPFKLGEFIYSTNGHVAIRIRDDGSIQAAEIEMVKQIEKYFSGARGALMDIPALPAAEPCKHCFGKGVGSPKETCEECDGDGEFKYGTHYYECKECDGEGKVDSDEGEGESCDYCDGTGEERNQAVKVGVAYFSRRYLAKISAIPNVQFCTPTNENDICLFVFEGGEGCIMPMRV